MTEIKMHNAARLVLFALLAGALAFSQGCGKKDAPKAEEKPAAPAPPRPAAPTAPTSQVVEEKKADEVKVARRNPFRSYLATIKVSGGDGKPKPEPPPLQKYDVNLFKVSVVIGGISNPMAQITAPDGKKYNISKGTEIGVREGRVVEISGRRVLVEEIIRDDSGKEISRENIELSISADDKSRQGR